MARYIPLMPGAYSLPLIYDIAFGDRNVDGEVEFLLSAAEIHSGKPVGSAIELACGPGCHLRAMAHRGIHSDGLDLSAEMVDYANAEANREWLQSRVFLGDMRSWRAPRKYDLAYCLLVSFAHLLANDDILAHFACVADMLPPGGIYIISHAHPRDFYGSTEPSAARTWTAERDSITVETDWGGEDQTFDPITEIDELTITYTVTSEGNTERFESRERLRRLSFQTFLALVRLSGRFELVATYGDFDLGTRLESDRAVRMLAILRKLA